MKKAMFYKKKKNLPHSYFKPNKKTPMFYKEKATPATFFIFYFFSNSKFKNSTSF